MLDSVLDGLKLSPFPYLRPFAYLWSFECPPSSLLSLFCLFSLPEERVLVKLMNPYVIEYFYTLFQLI